MPKICPQCNHAMHDDILVGGYCDLDLPGGDTCLCRYDSRNATGYQDESPKPDLVLCWQGFEKRVENWTSIPDHFSVIILKRPTATGYLDTADPRFHPLPPRWVFELDYVGIDENTGKETAYYRPTEELWDIMDRNKKENLNL